MPRFLAALALALLAVIAHPQAVARAQPAGEHRATQAAAPGAVVEVPRLPGRPFDARGEVVYELFVRNATPEGTLAAARALLPQIEALGTTTVWLMPVYPIGVAERKGTFGSPYSIRDYTDVDPDLGTGDDFRAFVDEAHRLGMKVILDWVANHTAWDHPWVAAHPDWYTRDAAGKIVPPNPDWTDVADLDYSNAELRAEMTRAMRLWVDTYAVDGFRCDVAEMVPIDFWQAAIADLRARRSLLMLAEGATPELYGAGFDLTYDWPLYQAMKRVWNGAPLDDLAAPLAATRPLLRFTTNHDETAWDAPPMFRFNGTDGAMAAFWTVALLPGAPLVYNGQEHGNAAVVPLFEHVPIAATDFRTRDQTEAALLLREEHPVLREGALRVLDAANPDVLLFERVLGEARVLVAVNVRPRPATLALSADVRRVYEGTQRAGRRAATPGVRTVQVVTAALWDGTDGDPSRLSAPLGLPARLDLAPYEVRTFGTVVLRTR